MEREVRFSVSNGFRLRSRTSMVDLDKAAAMLNTRRQRRYTSAYRVVEQCVLTSHVIVCPFCGKSTPAYHRWSRTAPYEPEPRITAEQIRTWSENTSLFPEDNELVLNKVWNGSDFVCPRCQRISQDHPGELEIAIQTTGNCVCMTVFDVYPWDALVCMMKAKEQEYHISYPLKETVCFDLKKGKVVLRITDRADHALFIRDVSLPNEHWNACLVHSLLSRSDLAMRKLAQAFAAVWGTPLPYVRAELIPDSFLNLTQFRGYGRSFYDALPLDARGMLEKSFRTAARRIHDSGALPELYATTTLPSVKSIRRTFFESPQLFFYCPEAESLWRILGDINLFRIFLELPIAIQALAFFHFFPAADAFFRDYAAHKGPKGLLRILKKYSDSGLLWNYAALYTAGSDALRRREQKRWKEERVLPQASSGAFALPISVNVQTRDLEIDGFRFVWLRTRESFIKAGRALRNCLVYYNPEIMRAAIIKKKDRILAAVEVRRSLVVQAFGPNNAPIDPESSLYQALEKWAERCQYCFSKPEDALFIPEE